MVRINTDDTHANALRSLRKAAAGWRTLPESGGAVIPEDWRLPARLYCFHTASPRASFVRSLYFYLSCVFCVKKIPCVEEVSKQSLLVHLKPRRQNALGDARLLSNETIDIPSNRKSCMVYLEITNASLSAIPEIKVYLFERNQTHCRRDT